MHSVLAKALSAIILIVSFLALAPMPAGADSFPSVAVLEAKAATGAGTVRCLGKAYSTFTCQVNITGAPSAVTVRLEGNLSGTVYSTMGTHVFTAGELTATQAIFGVADMPAVCIRGYVETLTAGTAPTVTMTCTGVQ